jgi:hypothetical protein
MSGVATAVVASTVATGYFASRAQSRAADQAAGAEIQGTAMSVEEQRRQFDEVQKLLKPYIEAGTGALGAQQGLIGLKGDEAQAAAIEDLKSSPEFAAMVGEGENAILQNASATGGLRGGNTQLALSRFRPSVLSQLIQQQYERLGGLTSVGQASATGQAAAAQQTGANVSSLFQNQGTALANAALAKGNAQAQFIGGVGGTAGTLGTLKLLKAF